jgi:hypothetical protein
MFSHINIISTDKKLMYPIKSQFILLFMTYLSYSKAKLKSNSNEYIFLLGHSEQKTQTLLQALFKHILINVITSMGILH